MARKANTEIDDSKAKANGAGPGHNSRELTAEERKALFFHHFRKIADQKAKVDAEREEYKRLRKLAKTDSIVLADIDFALRCAELEDDSIVPAELKRQMEIASWFALPVEFQADMFADHASGMERIEKEGEAAGLAGKNRDAHGYAKGSPEEEIYLVGWQRGQKTLLDNLTSAQEKADAQREAEQRAKLVKKADVQAAEDDDDDPDPFEDGEGPASDDDDERDLRPRHLRNDEATRQQ